MMMYKCVIFDLDGTLLDTLEDLADSVNEMLRKFSCPERSLEEVRQFLGNGMKKLVERSVPESFDGSKIKAAYEFFREAYRENMRNKTRPYNGIAECLEELSLLGIRTAVTSNKNDDAVKNLCKEYFGERIALAVGVSEDVSPKPHPGMVNRVIDELGFEKNDCIFVGDSETDIRTAKNSGLASVGVLWGFRDRETLEKEGADYIISHPSELVGIII